MAAVKMSDNRRSSGGAPVMTEGTSMLLLAANLIFFLAFPLHDGPVMGVDTAGYINMVSMREALYPLFLAFFRRMTELAGLGEAVLYGQPFYLFPVVLFQCALAAVVTWRFALLADSFAASRRRGTFYAVIAVLCQWGSVLLQRFGSKRGACYQEVLLTEGLSLSFYLMFLICLVKIALKLVKTDEELRVWDFVKLGITVFLCISIRKQLFVTVVIAAAAAFFYILFRLFGRIGNKNGENRRAGNAAALFRWLLPLVISLAAAVVVSNGCEKLYNYARYGIMTTHTGSSMGLDCTLIYISDEKDKDLFEDPEIGEVFAEIRREAAQQNVLWDENNYGDWYQMFYHYSESYDVIGYNIMNPVIREYLAKRYDISAMNDLTYNMLVDEVEGEIKNTLLTQHIGKYLYIWWVNFRQGFAVSVLKSHHILNYLILLMYLAYFGMFFRLLYCLRKSGRKEADAGTESGDGPRAAETKAILVFAFLAMLGLVLNNAVVSAVIYNQTRYAIYVMSSFYAALLLMGVKMLEQITVKKKWKE